MSANAFRQALERYAPFDDQEESEKQMVLELLAETDMAFSRDYLKGHITGSSFVVNNTLDKTFLILHNKYDIWLQPGGHCDGDPVVHQTALRETEEETGLRQLKLVPEIFDISVHDIGEAMKKGKLEPAHKHYDIRYMIVANEDEKPSLQEEEVSGGRWFTLDEAIETNPWRAFSRMVDKIKLDREYYLNWIK